MTAPFVPRAVVARFFHAVLTADSGVTMALGSGVIVPDEGIPANVVLTLAQTFAGGVRVAKRMGAPIAQVEMDWEVTGWAPTYSREASEPLMVAAMAALIGSETTGKTHLWVDGSGGRAWAIDVDFASEEPVPLDDSTPQAWAPVRHRYRVALRPRGA
ncbi:MAG: hypothetical protein KC442_10570 [Thermomicrobiales bacterium]|nr:hypothetical protein [Thermomicrobiales bacterium]